MAEDKKHEGGSADHGPDGVVGWHGEGVQAKAVKGTVGVTEGAQVSKTEAGKKRGLASLMARRSGREDKQEAPRDLPGSPPVKKSSWPLVIVVAGGLAIALMLEGKFIGSATPTKMDKDDKAGQAALAAPQSAPTQVATPASPADAASVAAASDGSVGAAVAVAAPDPVAETTLPPNASQPQDPAGATSTVVEAAAQPASAPAPPIATAPKNDEYPSGYGNYVGVVNEAKFPGTGFAINELAAGWRRESQNGFTLRVQASGDIGVMYAVRLDRKTDGSPLVAAYLKGTETVDVPVPPGEYRIVVSYGRQWSGTASMFGPSGLWYLVPGVFTANSGKAGILNVGSVSDVPVR